MSVPNKQQKAIETLKEQFHIVPGDTIYTKLNHVSRSGMSRTIDVYLLRDNEPLRISWSVAEATGFTYDRKFEGVKVGGCGMDTGFEIVYNLGHYLFKDGFECIGDNDNYAKRCPSNDHSNGDRNYLPHHHESGGYALRHKWL
jgi:hypothetical protein